MQQQSDFFLDKVFWRNSAIIIYLTYPIIYPIIWAMSFDIWYPILVILFCVITGIILVVHKWQETITRQEFIPRTRGATSLMGSLRTLWWAQKHSKTGSASPGAEKSYPTTVDISWIRRSSGSRQRTTVCAWTSSEGMYWMPTTTTTSPSFKNDTVHWIMNT